MMLDDSTIDDDVLDDQVDDAGADDDNDVDAAAEALLKRWKPDASDKKPSGAVKKEQPERAQEETEEHETEESDTETEEKSEDEEGHEKEQPDEETGDKEDGKEQPESKLAADDHEVEITVDGEARRVPVKDLKRLYGQEAALTRKSQEVATARKSAEDLGSRHATALDRLVTKAKADWEPFSKIDFLVAQKNMGAEEFSQLRKEAQAAWNNLQFFQKELDQHIQTQQQEQTQTVRKAAVECVKALTDPESGIKGWDQKMYDSLRTFATGVGLDERLYNTLTDPAAFKLIHMAYQYSQVGKVAAVKIAKAPKNVVGKTKTTGTGTTAKKQIANKAMSKLRETGDIDDAADAFLARWGVGDED